MRPRERDVLISLTGKLDLTYSSNVHCKARYLIPVFLFEAKKRPLQASLRCIIITVVWNLASLA